MRHVRYPRDALNDEVVDQRCVARYLGGEFFCLGHALAVANEMMRTFNCGIGMIVTAEAAKAAEVEAALQAAGESPVRLGEIVPVAEGEEQVSYRGKLAL